MIKTFNKLIDNLTDLGITEAIVTIDPDNLEELKGYFGNFTAVSPALRQEHIVGYAIRYGGILIHFIHERKS